MSRLFAISRLCRSCRPHHHSHAAVGAFIANYTVLRESVRCHHKSVILPAKVDERTLDPLPKMIHEYTAGHRTQKRHSWTGEYEGFDFRKTSAHGTQVPVDESSARGCHADELYEGEWRSVRHHRLTEPRLTHRFTRHSDTLCTRSCSNKYSRT